MVEQNKQQQQQNTRWGTNTNTKRNKTMWETLDPNTEKHTRACNRTLQRAISTSQIMRTAIVAQEMTDKTIQSHAQAKHTQTHKQSHQMHH